VTVLLGDLTWEQLARDDHLRRLKRGKHFRGDVRAVQREAIAAGAELGRVARVVRDDFRKYAYVWVQFVDYQIPLGEPCPACGGREILRTHQYFGRCPACNASLALLARVESAEGSDAPPPLTKYDAKQQRAQARAAQWRLDMFTNVQLVFDPDESDEEQEVWYGRGDLEGHAHLLRVTYPLRDGARQPRPEEPEEELHFVRFWALEPYSRAADLGLDVAG
jgi:hypothetical protein